VPALRLPVAIAVVVVVVVLAVVLPAGVFKMAPER
jgi:hypothetical protein